MAVGYPVGVTTAVWVQNGDFTLVDTTQQNNLGQLTWDSNGNAYVYLKGVASLAAGDWIVYQMSTFTAVRLVNTPLTGHVAVALSANILATTFGWAQVFGLTPTTTAIATDSSADGLMLAQSSTAGRVTTTPAATKAIYGAVAVGAAASNVGKASIAFPFCLGTATL